LGTFRQPSLMVNSWGERIMDESIMCMPSYAGNVVKRQPGGCAYMILDEGINQYYESHRWDNYISGIGHDRSHNLPALIQKAMDEGHSHLCMADSLEELADLMGIDAEGLKSTVKEYNSTCVKGHDPMFYKPFKFLRPIIKPPFYAARFYVSAYATLGGISIDYKGRVINREKKAIVGLYAAGNDANNLYGDTYPFFYSGNTSGFCYNSGRIAGENAAAYSQTI